MNKVYLDYQEIERMIEAAENLRDRLLLLLLAHLGCRISEALSISVDDVDLANGTVTIKHLKSRLKLKCPNCQAGLGLTSVYCPKCGEKVESALKELKDFRRQRILPVDKALLVHLRDYITRGGPVIRNGKRLLFGVNRHRAWQIIKTLGEKAGLPRIINTETGKVHNISPHKLRDAFAVHAVKHDDTGDGLRMLQEHLGHQSFNTTAKYRKVAGEEHRKWYDDLWKSDGNSAKT
ncbi:tyrosine-type recombinase/integrase [Dehalococcoides mccartyi]|uniref:Site-specific recombinase, phage integrase family n=1 Tax=Dehalococcoides mccartyi (strain ATCC BAA-2266 / KCTC 15142 / 195) TaxID=243164 RepID=Q3ZA43_DEHM1|nr:tyrosine-type recombinase/integrase [Dehalococcoides mccartyi]AAW40492.1 site-specific recombinase, phage integrase family [Dehalococcoides mccartyi 195]AQU06183.1 integrase [Dehalococcoides mccartyi]AQU07625.1 integrase [Dehalococcoides mccartyi]